MMNARSMTVRKATTLTTGTIARLRDGEVAFIRNVDFGIGPKGFWVAANGATVDSLTKEQATEGIINALTGKA